MWDPLTDNHHRKREGHKSQIAIYFLLPFFSPPRSIDVASHWPSPAPAPLARTFALALIMPMLLVYSSAKHVFSVCRSPRRLCPSSMAHVSTNSSHHYSSAGLGDLPSANAPWPFLELLHLPLPATLSRLWDLVCSCSGRSLHTSFSQSTRYAAPPMPLHSYHTTLSAARKTKITPSKRDVFI